MPTGKQDSKLDLESKGTVVQGECGPQVYFHPGSATLLLVDAKDNRIIEQEHATMAALLEKQKSAELLLDEINYEMLTQSGMKPQRVYQGKLQQAYTQLNEANDKLRAELKVLTAKVPEGELLDESSKESSVGLMELIPIKKTTGFKATYVRSDRIRSHWRKYKLSEIDKKSGEASFIKYKNKEVGAGYDANGREIKKTVRSAKVDTKELISQFKDASSKLNIDLVEDSNIVITDWAKKMNKGLTWPQASDKPDDESTYHEYVDISAQAQLMRYSQGIGLSAEYNPLKGKVSAKLGGHASFALGEAKAAATLYIPDRLGISLLFPAKLTPESPSGGVCNMGAIRYAINMTLSGSAGASLAIELGVEADFSGEMGKGYGIKGHPVRLSSSPPPGQKKINLMAPLPDVKAGGELGAFVGIQAGGNVSGAIEWFDPHPEEDNSIQHGSGMQLVPTEKKFTAIAKLTIGMNVQAGVGGSGQFYITYIDYRFRIYCKAALCWGVGAKGSLGFEVDGSSFWAFMKSFMYMLRNVDYIKLTQMIEGGAFRALCSIPLLIAAETIQAIDFIYDTAIDVIDGLMDALNSESNRVTLMNSILSNPDQLKYTPPETKGAVIAMLIDLNWLDLADPRNQSYDILSLNAWKIGPLKRRKKAIFKALKWVQSESEYINVMQHLTVSPGSGKGNYISNERRVVDFLAYGEIGGIFATSYGTKIWDLRANLPWNKDPDAPFLPIPDVQMAEYLAVIEKQHPENTMIS